MKVRPMDSANKVLVIGFDSGLHEIIASKLSEHSCEVFTIQNELQSEKEVLEIRKTREFDIRPIRETKREIQKAAFNRAVPMPSAVYNGKNI